MQSRLHLGLKNPNDGALYYNIFGLKMKRSGSLIPQRQLNWKKYDYLRNRQNKIFYDCECGSRYVSFPALFLHFQRKHNCKISTKHLPHECSFSKNGDQTIYFYFLKQKPKQTTFKASRNSASRSRRASLSAISHVLKEFQAETLESFSVFCGPKEFEQVIKNFYAFLESSFAEDLKREKGECWEKLACENLPYYFNSFVCEGMAKDEGQYMKVCSILMLLWQWLSTKNYTNLVVEYNNDC